MADHAKTAAEKAHEDAAAATLKANALRDAANAPGQTKEQKAASEAALKADDARAKAAEAGREEVTGDTEAHDANVLGTKVDPDMSVGEHMAQKFGNDPANPKYAAKVSTAEEAQTIRLYRVTPDSPTPVYTFVAPEMVGDYMRAGWNRSDDTGVEMVAAPGDATNVADRR